mmetsp:Transcript_147075/g.208577  ORF Transcript_147075/g.208577 Transcript_147075/m.208577 type:complete len:110 (+) Transcript_147075:232-561(+)
MASAFEVRLLQKPKVAYLLVAATGRKPPKLQPFTFWQQPLRRIQRSNEVGDVHWHLFDLGVVEPLKILHDANVVVRNKIDGHALSTEPTAASNPVKVILHVGWKIIVDH